MAALRHGSLVLGRLDARLADTRGRIRRGSARHTLYGVLPGGHGGRSLPRRDPRQVREHPDGWQWPRPVPTDHRDRHQQVGHQLRQQPDHVDAQTDVNGVRDPRDSDCVRDPSIREDTALCCRRRCHGCHRRDRAVCGGDHRSRQCAGEWAALDLPSCGQQREQRD
ncbi:hypothetical protein CAUPRSCDRAFT_13117 [Caulochytrium protostelioides]|uniref:Uncharacterized protein n=1 Tax=Caulochytrium protostelioides TaxID=1555241 RepID=A0A4P9WSH6_9FUNG|nr:hypothetical protein CAUPRSCDRAFT_13117 [Caulochytrium protostelioides]